MITADADIAACPARCDPLAARLTQYADWGTPCFSALGTPLWPGHLTVCERCLAVQARWDRQAAVRALWERVHRRPVA